MKPIIKTLVSVGALTSAFAFANTSHAVEGMFRIAPKIAPHKSFDLPGGGCPYNAPNAVNTLTLYTHDNTCGNGDQRWYIHDVGGGQHEIRQGGPGGKCLDIEGGGSGYRLGTWTCNGGTGQKWWFTETYNANNDGSNIGPNPYSQYGEWRITSVRDGRAIDLDNANTANGTQIRVWGNNESDAQRWILWSNGGMHEDFSDDFNDSTVDTNVWHHGNMNPGQFNGEEQSYRPEQCWEQNGHLTMVANNVNNGTGPGSYKSCRLNSKGKRWYRNGTFSARLHYYSNINGPNHGTWPAFWLLGNNVAEDPVTGGGAGGACWPTAGARELDVWEWAHNRGSVYTANVIASDQCQVYNSIGSREDAWWDPGQWIVASVRLDGDGHIKFYNGGRKVLDTGDGAHWNQDMAFILNLAVGGNLGENSDDFNSTSEWASVDVDWVAHETW